MGSNTRVQRILLDNLLISGSEIFIDLSIKRGELNQFITAVNSFHPALKYTWEISDTSLAFLDIKLSIEGNGLYTSVHYKPTDSHSYLLYSSSHPLHVKNSIPYSRLSFDS